jgi:general secretion pathway protein G
MRLHAKTRSAFTLVELVVVVMILGILAGIAAPRMLGASHTATDNAVRQSLSVIRDAIDRYTAENNGQLPGADSTEGTFLANIGPYLRGGTIPFITVTAAGNNKDVYIMQASDTPGNNGGVGTHAWAYDPATGEFYVNSPDLSSDGVTTYDQF